MKQNKIALYLFVSFAALAVISFFIKISQQTLVMISVSSLVFTAAQTLQSYISLKNEDTETQIEIFNTVGDFNLDTPQLIMMKKYAQWFSSPKKVKILNASTTVLECVAVLALFIGIIVPMPFFENENLSVFATILSFAFLFLSVWLVEKYTVRKSEWEFIQLIYEATKNSAKEKVKEDTPA